jgi:hypothetical protein
MDGTFGVMFHATACIAALESTKITALVEVMNPWSEVLVVLLQ